ncbi:hypothetical protein [Streptomyces sp. NPDC050564]|uniref:hypothetical protein n=1 Tax=Streptomyces sp. NPDC050564 TaxID=3365631 RepID=UPI0037882A93
MCHPSPHDRDSRQDQQATSAPTLFRGRTVLVLLLSVLCGIATGALWCAASHSWPEAVVTGGAAAGGALGLFHQLVGPQW